MAIPHYKLKFFPVKGRGEIIRILFAFAEVPYEDHHIPLEKWMDEFKHTTPFGSLPILEIDNGKEWLGQHLAISRYLANRFGIAGKDTLDRAKADMFVDGTAELWTNYVPAGRAILGGNHEIPTEAGRKFVDETFKPWADRYTKFLNQNGTGWFVGTSLTWADIYIAEWCDRVTSCIDHHALTGHSDLKAHMDRVKQIPQIAKYFQSRPKTPL